MDSLIKTWTCIVVIACVLPLNIYAEGTRESQGQHILSGRVEEGALFPPEGGGGGGRGGHGKGGGEGGDDQHLKHGAELYFNNSLLEFVDLTDGDSMFITFLLDDPLPFETRAIVLREISPDSFGHISLRPDRWSVSDLTRTPDGRWAGSFNLTGTFLGFSKILLLMQDTQGVDLAATKDFEVKVQRSDKLLDTIFTVSVIILVAGIYVNMGCAIDMEIIQRVLRRPVAPLIGLASQYLFMPITSYALGYALFYDSPAQWLGLFMIGSSPGGGGSNVWTYLLGGSLDLSVTMTLISTIAAFGALPMWVYALAKTIFRDGNFSKLPYASIAGMVAGLILPCGLGLLIKKYFPNVAETLKKLLKVSALIFIIFVLTFGIYVNLHIFSFFTWKVALAGLALPWLGFIFGFVFSLILKRSWEEVVAISVETGIQNTGLAIGVIKFAMEDFSPLGDITVVIPVAVASLTPIPLLICLVIKKLHECYHRKGKEEEAITGGGTGNEEGKDGSNSMKMTPASSQTPLSSNFR